MGKIAGKVPKLQEKLFDFPYFRQKFDRLFLSPYRLTKKTSKKKEQSATVSKDVYCYRYCFLETKECMHNEVGTCAEILPKSYRVRVTAIVKLMYFHKNCERRYHLSALAAKFI